MLAAQEEGHGGRVLRELGDVILIECFSCRAGDDQRLRNSPGRELGGEGSGSGKDRRDPRHDPDCDVQFPEFGNLLNDRTIQGRVAEWSRTTVFPFRTRSAIRATMSSSCMPQLSTFSAAVLMAIRAGLTSEPA